MKHGALVPAVLLLALAGCSSGGPAPNQQTGTQSTAASGPPTSQAPSAPASSEPADVSTSLNDPGALRQHSCTAAADGTWSFTGTLVNGTGKDKVFTVAIAVTVGPAVAGHTLITKTVAAGQSADIAAPKFAKTKDAGGKCDPVVSVEDAP